MNYIKEGLPCLAFQSIHLGKGIQNAYQQVVQTVNTVSNTMRSWPEIQTEAPNLGKAADVK